MDKNTLIGLILILGLFLGYSLYISPSKEERAEMQRQHDSLVAAQEAEQLAYADSVIAARESGQEGMEIADTSRSEAGYAHNRSQYGHFVKAGMVPAEDEASVMSVENDLYRLWIDRRGGRICKVELKNVRTFDSLPVVLFDESSGDANRFGFDLSPIIWS